ncbi:unnamed protein product [Closterium sp. NIES-54]
MEPPHATTINPTGPAHLLNWDFEVIFGSKSFRGRPEACQIISRDRMHGGEHLPLGFKKKDAQLLAYRAAFRNALLGKVSCPGAHPPADADRVAELAKEIAKAEAKGLLQVDCSRMLQGMPAYTTAGYGPSHCPSFTTTVELPNDWGSYTGNSCPTKGLAEKDAAFAAWWGFFIVGPFVQGGEDGTLNVVDLTEGKLENGEEEDAAAAHALGAFRKRIRYVVDRGATAADAAAGAAVEGAVAAALQSRGDTDVVVLAKRPALTVTRSAMASQLVVRVSTTAAPTLAAAAAAAVATAAVSSEVPDRRAVPSPAVLVHSAMAASPATSGRHRFTHAIADPAASRFKTSGVGIASSMMLQSAASAAASACCPESSPTAASPMSFRAASASYHLPPVSYRGLGSSFTGSATPYALESNRFFSPSRQQLSRLIAPSTLFPIPRLSQRSIEASYGSNPSGNPFGFPLGNIFSLTPSSLPISGPFNGDVQSSKPFHQWHLPAVRSNGDGVAGELDGSGPPSEAAKPVVVLLGWLGAQQKHLRRYAEWYTSRGFDVITFVIPFKDVLSIRPGEKAEVHVDSLVDELHRWLSGAGPEVALSATSAPVSQGEAKEPRTLMFHTFSNTGWLTYGAVLNRLHDKYGKPAIDAVIKGCVVDSAPILEQDPQVWARGFAAAILQKRSSATRAGRTDVSATAEASAAADSAVTASESSSAGGAAKGSSEGVEKEANGKVWGVTETGEWDAQPRDETRSAAIDARPVASDGPKHHHRSSLGFASLTAEMDVVGEGEEGEERRRSAGGVAGVRAGEGVGVEKVVKAEEDAVEKTLLNVLRRFFTWVLQLPVVKTEQGTRDEHEESDAKAKCEKEEGTTGAEEEGKQPGRGQEEEAEDQRREERGGREEKERGDRGSEDQRQEEEVAAAAAAAAAAAPASATTAAAAAAAAGPPAVVAPAAAGPTLSPLAPNAAAPHGHSKHGPSARSGRGGGRSSVRSGGSPRTALQRTSRTTPRASTTRSNRVRPRLSRPHKMGGTGVRHGGAGDLHDQAYAALSNPIMLWGLWKRPGLTDALLAT